MCLWKLRSSTTCHLQAGCPGKPLVPSQSMPPNMKAKGPNGTKYRSVFQGFEPGVPTTEDRRWMSQFKQKAHSSFLHLFALSRYGIMPTILVRVTFFSQSTKSQAIFLQKHSHQPTQKKNAQPALSVTFNLIKLMHKMNNHICSLEKDLLANGLQSHSH